ncbi:MAG: hypothetical protein NTW52_18615 [Planctomycetota bacterium]|nr:hypothetical protein [Planctomycetota bacterium]
MRQFVHDVLDRQYKKLCKGHPELNGFEDFDEFVEAYQNCPGAIDFDADNVIYRKNEVGLFAPDNTKWLAIIHDSQKSEGSYPTISGGSGNE